MSISEPKDSYNAVDQVKREEQHGSGDKENCKQQQQVQHLHHGLRHRSNIRAMLNVPPTINVVNSSMPSNGQNVDNITNTTDTDIKSKVSHNLNAENVPEEPTSFSEGSSFATQTLPANHPPQSTDHNQQQHLDIQQQSFASLHPKVTLMDDGKDLCDTCDAYGETNHPIDVTENDLEFVENTATAALHEDQTNDRKEENLLFSRPTNYAGDE